jgi:hypothetical protein
MPNYCHNRLVIEGADKELDRLARAVADPTSEDENTRFSYARIAPLVGGEDEGEAWGSTSLYCLKVLRSRRELVYEFESAWDPPCAVIDRLAQAWPGLTFELVFVEPLTDRYGTRYYKEGARTHWNEVSGSRYWSGDDSEMRHFVESEWPELADKWWGDEYEDEEYDPQENPYWEDAA